MRIAADELFSSAAMSDYGQTPGKYERALALSSAIRRTGFAGPRSNRMLLPLSICGRKMRGCLANKKAHKKHDGKL